MDLLKTLSPKKALKRVRTVKDPAYYATFLIAAAFCKKVTLFYIAIYSVF